MAIAPHIVAQTLVWTRITTGIVLTDFSLRHKSRGNHFVSKLKREFFGVWQCRLHGMETFKTKKPGKSNIEFSLSLYCANKLAFPNMFQKCNVLSMWYSMRPQRSRWTFSYTELFVQNRIDDGGPFALFWNGLHRVMHGGGWNHDKYPSILWPL